MRSASAKRRGDLLVLDAPDQVSHGLGGGLLPWAARDVGPHGEAVALREILEGIVEGGELPVGRRDLGDLVSNPRIQRIQVFLVGRGALRIGGGMGGVHAGQGVADPIHIRLGQDRIQPGVGIRLRRARGGWSLQGSTTTALTRSAFIWRLSWARWPGVLAGFGEMMTIIK